MSLQQDANRKQNALKLAKTLHDEGKAYPEIAKELFKKLGYKSQKTGKALTSSGVGVLLKNGGVKTKKKTALVKKNEPQKKLFTPTKTSGEQHHHSSPNVLRTARDILDIKALSNAEKVKVLRELLGKA